MAIDNEIKDLLNDFGENLLTDTRNSLKAKLDAKASKYKSRKVNSRLSATMKPQTTFESGGITFRMYMNDYWDAVNSGRSPTEKSGDGSVKKKIEEWIKTRGVAVKISKRKEAKLESLKSKGKFGKKIKKAYKQQTYDEAVKAAAYGIAQKIHKDGYEGNHFFDEVINDGRTEKLKEDIAKLIQTEVIIDIQQATK